MKEMINSIKKSNFYIKNEKIIKKVLILLGILLFLFLIWILVIKNYVTFYNMEKEMKSGAETYFSRNLEKRPKEIGEISTVSLQKLYERKVVSSMYIPGTKKLCSTDNSWVKSKKTNTGYDYYVYLECGRYHSNADHEGPEIILNGDDDMKLEFGANYQEPGVKSVKDNKDGDIDTNKVQITGKINNKKVGIYKIKYVVFDSLRNKTVKYRNVKVTKTLSYIAKQDNKDGIYKGNIDNNYVWYSGALWRMVKVNSDNTVKLITDDSLANISYSSGMSKDGYVYKWLNEYYYNLLYNPKDYIVESKWCNDETSNLTDTTTNCKNEVSAKVGLITLSEYNQSKQNDNTYLTNGMTFWTMTRNTDKDVYGVVEPYTIDTIESTNYNGVRPTINIKSNISAVSGDGSQYKPYVLENYNYGKSGKLLNTRYAGEYIYYSGYLWRIQNVDKNKNTQVVMTNVLKDGNGNIVEIGYDKSYANKPKKFNVTSKGNIGYKLNHELKDYLITKKMVEGTYKVNFYKNGLIDEKAKNTEVTALLSIPDMTEVFSLGKAQEGQNAFFVRNTLDSGGELLMVNGSYQTREFLNFVFNKASIKVVTRFDKNVKIKGGKGTETSPYELR